jgi:tRNA G18 (ribose-2'-O)-methylase SpoU
VAEPVPIDDPADPRVADFVDATDAALRRRHGLFLIEGELVLRRALASGTALRSLLLTPPRWRALADALHGVDAPVYLAAQAVMDAVAGFPIHRGVLAAAPRPPLATVAEVVAGATVVAVVEGLTDHENLGGIFRNAAALGVGAVLVDPRCADPLYRRAVRVSMGHVLRLPWTRVDPWPDGLDDLRAAGWTLVALTPSPEAEPLSALAPAPGEKVAVLLGAEGSGLSAPALVAADRRVRIPMAAGVDSLNVATAAAIAFHHLGDRAT